MSLAPSRRCVAKEWRKVWQLAALLTPALATACFTAAAPRWGRGWCLPLGPVVRIQPAFSAGENTHCQASLPDRPWCQPARISNRCCRRSPSGSGAANVKRTLPALAVRRTVHDARSQDLSHRNLSASISRKASCHTNTEPPPCRHSL